jgi:lysophospholipase L1-like esterase
MMVIRRTSRLLSSSQLASKRRNTALSCHRVALGHNAAPLRFHNPIIKPRQRLSHSSAHRDSPRLPGHEYESAFALLPMSIGGSVIATLLVSAVQGLSQLYRYRNDVRGKLRYPMGLTWGVEHCPLNESQELDDHNKDVDQERIRDDDDVDRDQGTIFSSFVDAFLAVALENIEDPELIAKLKRVPTIPSLIEKIRRNREGIREKTQEESTAVFVRICALFQRISKRQQQLQEKTNESIRVLVIGDSLAIGVGCSEVFDTSKGSSTSALALVENTKMPDNTSLSTEGPVFPRALAQSLSRHFRLPVRWRSAGVDGGDVNDIRSLCMDVVKQECSRKDKPVDIIVVLFGMNDLKRLLSNYEGGINHFRLGIDNLLHEIRSHAPGALVVLPEIPFHSNVFPLGLVLDSAMGVWERLKRLVANNQSNAMYLGLNPQEILNLHRSGQKILAEKDTESEKLVDEHGDSIIDDLSRTSKCDGSELLSPDHVHPNKILYRKWAELVGSKLYKKITTDVELNNY